MLEVLGCRRLQLASCEIEMEDVLEKNKRISIFLLQIGPEYCEHLKTGLVRYSDHEKVK
jgi:hypothetical protein